MSGLHADPGVLDALATKLGNASSDMEESATQPPQAQAGAVSGAVNSALALLADGLGNVSMGVASVSEATAESRAVYVETDYEQAAELRAQELKTDQPR